MSTSFNELFFQIFLGLFIHGFPLADDLGHDFGLPETWKLKFVLSELDPGEFSIDFSKSIILFRSILSCSCHLKFYHRNRFKSRVSEFRYFCTLTPFLLKILFFSFLSDIVCISLFIWKKNQLNEPKWPKIFLENVDLPLGSHEEKETLISIWEQKMEQSLSKLPAAGMKPSVMAKKKMQSVIKGYKLYTESSIKI